MNRLSFISAIILLVLFLISCKNEDNEKQSDSIEISVATDTSLLIKTEKVLDQYQSDYSYNSRYQLSDWHIRYPSFSCSVHFIYGPEGKLIIREYHEGVYSGSSNKSYYTYDRYGKLTGYDSVRLTYSDSSIIVSGKINGDKIKFLELFADSTGNIRLLKEKNKYTQFTYDSAGNMVGIFIYKSKGLLQTVFKICYDDKINPFCGQFKAVYLERFLNSFFPTKDILISGFEGYCFPFFKNNIISVSKNNSIVKCYSYTYNDKNFPVNVTEVAGIDTLRYRLYY